MEIINNVLELMGTSMGTILLYIAGGALVGFPMLPESVKTKIKSLLGGLKFWGKSAPEAGGLVDDGLDFVEGLAHSKRIADAKKVLDIIEGIQKDEPAVKPEPSV